MRTVTFIFEQNEITRVENFTESLQVTVRLRDRGAKRSKIAEISSTNYYGEPQKEVRLFIGQRGGMELVK